MRSVLTDTLPLRTPEGIIFALPLAGPVSRLLAWTIDTACLSAAASMLGKILSGLGVLDKGLAQATLILGYFALSIGYGIALEWYWRGQTVGKRLLGLRVMDAHGLHLEFSQVVVRNLLRAVDALPLLYLVGGTACALSSKCQRLGDIAARTIVVRNLRPPQPDLEQVLGDKFNSLAEHRRLAARLRQRVSPSAAGVALEAVLRRDEFDPAARLTLFAELADHFRNLLEFPPEAADQLSDEQYVRNVVGILFYSAPFADQGGITPIIRA
jgi:uncharacterized RDD family membrane protein YckC